VNRELKVADIIYYLSQSFSTMDGYHTYIKWLHDKINCPRSLKQCIIHYGSESIFSNFTRKLCPDMCNDFCKRVRGRGEMFIMRKIMIGDYINMDNLKEIADCYKHDMIETREIYQAAERRPNEIDYELIIGSGIVNGRNGEGDMIDIPYSSEYGRFYKSHCKLIARKDIDARIDMKNKLFDALNDRALMQQVFEFIKNLDV